MSHFRTTTSILVMLLWGGNLLAQAGQTRVKVRMGMEGDGDARLPAIGLVKTGSNAVLVQRQAVDEDGVVKDQLDLYDRSKLGFLRTQPPVSKLRNGAKVVPDRVVAFAGHTIMISRAYGASAMELYYQFLEPNITKLPPPYERICSWPVALPTPTEVDPANFEYAFTPDSGLLLMRSPMVHLPGGHRSLVGVWSKDMSVLWQRSLAGAEGAVHSSVLDAVLDTSGSAYFLVRDRMARSEVVDGGSAVRLNLYRVNAEGVTVVEVPLAREHFLMHGILRQLPGGGLVLGGVYGRVKEDQVETLGDLVVEIGSEGVVAEPLLMPYGNDNTLITEGGPPVVAGQKFLEKDVERLMSGIRLVDLLPRPDGGYFMVKELYFMETYFDLKTKRSADRYIHGSIQATAVGSGGQVEWNSLFRRWVKSAIPGMGEILAGVYGGELYLFVLDSEEMAALRKSGGKMVPDMMDGPYTAHVTFDAKGASKVKPVLKSGDESGYIFGGELYRFGPAEYYTIGSEKPEGGRTLPVRIDLSSESR